MPESPLLYYITDRTAFPGDEPTRRRHLLDKIAEAARAHIDYIQLREKDLSTRDLESLARTETMVSDFLKLTERAMEDPEMRQRLTDCIAPLFRRKDMPAVDDAKLREWIERASAMGVDLLLDS